MNLTPEFVFELLGRQVAEKELLIKAFNALEQERDELKKKVEELTIKQKEES